ncbi:MAG TPA: FAD-dependent oxidoreductase [Hydrogenispora sp.]|nr:FAD-dependent oxidoreductase [Hydrogenispora sp.]
MPLDESKLSFTIPRTEAPREKIIKLGQMITDRLPAKLKGVTGNDPEYWGLAGLVTDEMADIALKMGVRKPKTLPELVKLTGKDEAHLEKILHEMAYIGLIEYNWENPQREKQYVLPRFVPGSAEFFNMRKEQIDEHPEVAAFFERMTFLPLERVTPMVPPGGAGIGMHVIPVEKAIETENEAISIERISYWLKKYDGKYAKSVCSCRLSRAKLGEGCGDDPENWCIAIGDMADYVVETDRGEYITYDEVLAILKQAEENGFVHQITNIDGENKIFAICNCNVNVCYALRTSQLFNTPNLSRSAYVAKIENENCVACGRCVEHCPAGAVKLGQKLCTKDGPIEYPQVELPDENPWGPEKWSIDYRDKNRINCHETGTAPCKTACPAHIAVQGYLKLAAQGKYREALGLIKRDNPFPAVCGRICNRRCEEECTRGAVDQAVAIDEVKRFIAQLDLDAKTRYIPEPVIPKIGGGFEEKIAIIGAGPAGMSCAYFLALKGYKPTVFEKESRPGGMLMNGIPSFRLEKDVVEAEIDILREMGVEFKCGVEVGKDVTIPELRRQGYKGFFVAVGLQNGTKLQIPGADSAGVIAGIDFLRQVNLEGEYKLSGKVVVIGGGNVACDVARTAVRCNAESVSMYCLESYEEMPCGVEERTECEKEGITIHAGWGPAEIIANNGKTTGITFKKCLSVLDDEGRFAPTYDESSTETVECDVVIYCIGQKGDWQQLLKDTNVEFNPNGTIKADPVTYQTSEPDLFVGGDAYSGPKFVIDAIAAGREGAISLHRYVQPNTSLTIGRNRRDFIELDKKNVMLDLGSFDNTPRQRIGYNEALAKTFRDNRIAFTEEQVKKETARCLDCGVSVVDPNKCIGCGVCTTMCDFDAIRLHRERPECSTMVPTEDKMKVILPYMLKRALKIKFGRKKGK